MSEEGGTFERLADTGVFSDASSKNETASISECTHSVKVPQISELVQNSSKGLERDSTNGMKLGSVARFQERVGAARIPAKAEGGKSERGDCTEAGPGFFFFLQC